MKKSEVNLSIIMPCYNEGKNIFKNIYKTIKVIEKFEKNFEIICVNDGSKDNTESEIIKATKKDKRIKLVSYKKNQGKGYALKIGTKEAMGNLIAFIDSDLELSPSFIEKYIKIMEIQKADVVIASKMHKDSNLNYPIFRKILSIGYYLILKVLFRLEVKDTQTGLKLFKSKIIKDTMSILTTKSFAFDIEMLVIINKFGYKIVDAPIDLNFTRNHTMGRIKINDIFKMFYDTLKIFKKYFRKKLYIGDDNVKELFFFIGTEAELMKMYNIILEAKKRNYIVHIVSNGQNNIENSKYLEIIEEKIDVDLTKYIPKRKGMASYLKWFIKTRKLGIKTFKKLLKNKNKSNCLMFVHGDTLSTLMGAMIARKNKLKYVHVESGFRSHNWFSPFPEEIDRYFSSKKSIINFCQNEEATKCAEKYFKGKAVNTIYNTGIEILYSALEECKKEKIPKIIDEKYFLFTLHRQENLLNGNFLKNVVENICELSKKMKCVFIYHVQTKEALEKFGLWSEISKNKRIKIIDRQDYINFINIVDKSEFVIGDGCGNQQEFYFMGKPYLILRTRVEDNSEGLNWNAKPFENNFKNIIYFYDEYKKYTKKPIKMDILPSKIVLDEIDLYFKNACK